MRLRFVILGGAAGLAIQAMPVASQDYDASFEACSKASTPEQRIQACSAVIAANREPPEMMAKIYYIRGLVERRLSQNDKAMADYNQSIKLAPSSEAFNSRCYLFAISNRLQEALKDCNDALRL